MSTSNNSVTLIPKPQHHIVHREEQWMMIDSEIRKRLTEPVLTKSVIAIFGTAGIGKSTFLRETLITRLQENIHPCQCLRLILTRNLPIKGTMVN